MFVMLTLSSLHFNFFNKCVIFAHVCWFIFPGWFIKYWYNHISQAKNKFHLVFL